MTKTELVREVAKKATTSEVKYTQADVDNVLAAYGDVVLNALRSSTDDKEKIIVPGLGYWVKKLVKGREGVSALTGKAYKTEDRFNLSFKPSASVKVL